MNQTRWLRTIATPEEGSLMNAQYVSEAAEFKNGIEQQTLPDSQIDCSPYFLGSSTTSK
ncbi:MAG: hypothetical protein AAGA46_14400 [Cyanobacteria bacterium P01_F01_bin.13]